MPTDREDSERDHRMARLMRHEVGDLLQSVYSTVAVLLDRLPGELTLERRLVGELKNRAEVCKNELDAVVDLATLTELAVERIDLGGMFDLALGQMRRRFPALGLEVPDFPPVTVRAAPRALANALGLVLRATCQSARQRVRVEVVPSDRHVNCLIERDGYPLTPEQLAWLHTPFSTTQQATFGLGLALLLRALRPGGGEVEAQNRPEGGVVVRIRFPVCADP